MSKPKTLTATSVKNAASKRTSVTSVKTMVKAASVQPAPLIEPIGASLINARKTRPVLALLPSVRAARSLDTAGEPQASPTDKPTPLRAIRLNPEALSLDAFIARLVPELSSTLMPTPDAHPVRATRAHTTLPPSCSTLSSSLPQHGFSPLPLEPLTLTATASSSMHLAHQDMALQPARAHTGQTLAERLEMSKLARDTELNAVHTLARTHARASLLFRPQPSMSSTAPLVKSPSLLRFSIPYPLPPLLVPVQPVADLAPLASVNVDSHRVSTAPYTLMGVALAYMDAFQLHIGGPVASLWQHLGSVAAAIIHVFIPLLLAYIFSHWNPSMQAIFLEGGLLANLGKMCWLFIVSSFGWTLLYIIGARMIQSMRFDWGRFERIGRGFLSAPNHPD